MKPNGHYIPLKPAPLEKLDAPDAVIIIATLMRLVVGPVRSQVAFSVELDASALRAGVGDSLEVMPLDPTGRTPGYRLILRPAPMSVGTPT